MTNPKENLMIDYKKLANGALEARAALVDEARRVDADRSIPLAERRERVRTLNRDIELKTDEARGYVETGEREAEVRKLAERAGPLVMPGALPSRRDASEDWGSLFPSTTEARAAFAESSPGDGGYAVPVKVRDQAIKQLRARSVFLSAPGLNVLPMDSQTLTMPAIGSWSEAAVTAENATIATGSQVLTGPTLTAIKFADLRTASNEVLSDSAVDLRRLIAEEAIRNIGQLVDKQAFGAGNGTTALKGLTATGQSVNTAYSSGQGRTSVVWDSIIESFAAVVAGGATPTVIWCSADSYGPLLKERENAAAGQGAYLAGAVTGNPAQGALGLPLLPSANLPAKTVIVADASRVFVGLRQEVSLAVSEHVGFTTDSVAFRATFRLGGIFVAEPGSVQRITAAAT